MDTLERPQSWSHNFSLPNKTIDEKDKVYDNLMCDLFHTDDVEANKIKMQYLAKYTFIDPDVIKGW